MNKILLCTGFHRSATSVTANYLLNAGLPMGNNLFGSHFSNKQGHYEDAPVVYWHDSLLRASDTNWQFCDDSELIQADDDLAELKKYVAIRDTASGAHWGVKDPRACLFLPYWEKVLGDRGCYLFLIRHWSGCINSLLSRHSLEIIKHSKFGNQTDLNFWEKPTLAARMWLSYNYRLLKFAKENHKSYLMLTQRSLFEGAPLIHELNKKFGFDLDDNEILPYQAGLLSDRANDQILSMLPTALVHELNTLWDSLLGVAEFKSENESPNWLKPDKVIQQRALQFLSCRQPSIDVDSELKKINIERKGNSPLESLLNYLEFKEVRVDVINRLSNIKQSPLADFYPEIVLFINENYKVEQHIHISVGEWLMLQKQWSLAKSVWHWCCCLRSSSPYFYLQLYRCYMELKEHKLAVYFLDIAFEKSPDNTQVLFEKAKILRLQGKVAEALAIFERALQLDNKNIALVKEYYSLLEQEGHLEKAELLLSNVLDSNPGNQYIKMLQNQLIFKKGHFTQDVFLAKEREKILEEISTQNYSRYFQALKSCGSSEAEKDLIYRFIDHMHKAGIITLP